MSIKDMKANKELPDIFLTESISRNKAFSGLSHRRTNSADATFSSSKVDVTFDSASSKTLYSTIGPSYDANRRKIFFGTWLNAIKFSKSGKLKLPRPERTQIVFDSISKGLKDSILLAQNSISNSKLAFDNVSVSSVMMVKANERYLKKLEFHISKIEELKEQYDFTHKIRDGIRTMGYAYILSPGKLKETALQSVKSEFKENTKVMCIYENNLESLMGTLFFEMIGIQGFARICCGDVFEVVVKHGDQKWKTRGRVIKNGDQIWENKSVLFKALFDEPLCIKALEVRGLGKNILLGNKFCETRDLFSAHPQQMTINLNPSGSLKLNLLITWNPLNNGCIDAATLKSVPSTLSFHSCGRQSISHASIKDVDRCTELEFSVKQKMVRVANFCDSIASQSCTSESASPNSSVIHPNVHIGNVERESETARNEPNTIEPCRYLDSNLNDSWTALPNEENSYSNSISSSFHSLTDTLKLLLLTIEDSTKAYPEIQNLSQILEEIDTILKGGSKWSSGSNISLSIENALGCFDFLNTAIENDEGDISNDRSMENSNGKPSKKCNICNCDMMVEINSCKSEMFPLTVSSGNEDIDIVLTDHMLLCSKLISSLASFANVKCVESSMLKKLEKQIYCISSLLDILKKDCYCVCEFFDETENDSHQIWTLISGNGLYCVTDHFCFEMENVLTTLNDVESHISSTIAQRLAADILDVPHFEPTLRISVFQFKTHFKKSFHYEVQSCISDTLVAEDLKSKDIEKVFQAIANLSKIVPSSYSLFQVGSLLTDSNMDLKNVAISYFAAVCCCCSEDLKEKVLTLYLLMLQSDNVQSRLVASNAIELLQPSQYFKKFIVTAKDIGETSNDDTNDCIQTLP